MPIYAVLHPHAQKVIRSISESVDQFRKHSILVALMVVAFFHCGVREKIRPEADSLGCDGYCADCGKIGLGGE